LLRALCGGGGRGGAKGSGIAFWGAGRAGEGNGGRREGEDAFGGEKGRISDEVGTAEAQWESLEGSEMEVFFGTLTV
jgi:hypothetical protein